MLPQRSSCRICISGFEVLTGSVCSFLEVLPLVDLRGYLQTITGTRSLQKLPVTHSTGTRNSPALHIAFCNTEIFKVIRNSICLQALRYNWKIAVSEFDEVQYCTGAVIYLEELFIELFFHIEAVNRNLFCGKSDLLWKRRDTN
jgi:hypothetical protein